MKIFCDESGYTGADLLEVVQPYFVYSGVMLTKKHTQEIKDYIYKNYKIQNEEIKGKLLMGNSKGQKIALHIFDKYGHLARIVFHDKKYVLAAKIIEFGNAISTESIYLAISLSLVISLGR